MKPLPLSLSRPSQRASALVTVILFSFVLLTLAASVMTWSVTERRLNRRNGYWLEARNAAEAVAEYGAYEVAQAFNQNMTPTFGSGGNTQITFPSTVASSYFTGSHVDTSSIALNVGTVRPVPSSGGYYVNPADPNNTYDPLVGRYIKRRDVKILTKVTVTPPTGGGAPVTSYIEETVSVRGAPLLAYAVFYSNNDLEVNPQPLMDIWGPVHVNGNLFIGSVGSSPINFHGPVSVSGNIFHAWSGTTTTAKEGSGSALSSQDVTFPIDSTGGNLTSMKTSGGVWDDSTMGADSSTSGSLALTALVTPAVTVQFAQHASQTWNGNVQTSANGVQSFNPMGFVEQVAVDAVSGNAIYANTFQAVSGNTAASFTADNPATVGTSNLTAQYGAGYTPGYGPHALIDPALTVSGNDTYKTGKLAIESAKFANQAGLYIKVAVSGNATNTATITLYGDPGSHTGNTTGLTADGPNGGRVLGSTAAGSTTTIPGFVSFLPYTASGNNVTEGLYDQHQNTGVNLIQLDMGALRTALAHMAVTANTTGTAGTDILTYGTTTKWGATSYTNGYDPNNAGSTGWNGGVYVEVDNGTATNHTAVILANGAVASGSSLVPNNTSGNPAPNSVTGLTVATNAPVYILGSFNADGNVTGNTTNSALYPDDTPAGGNFTASKETPVAIAGDAVTILSANYFGTSASGNLVPVSSGNSTSAYASKTSADPTASASSEIAAAIIAGSNYTNGTAYSGGLHNMPRFLENWTSKTVAIRGSLISMFENKVDTVAWASDYYTPPNRQWGFDQVFASGSYPPMIPNVLSFRRVDFNYVIGPAAYAATLSGL